MKKTELIDGLTEDIVSYVMHGAFPEDELAADLKHDGLDERFEDYKLLMDLHFILKPEVVEFVQRLPERIRSVKTQTENVSQTRRGAVEGRINWSSTIKERYSGNPGDNSLFVTDNRTEHYDIDENIVLKRLLSIIYGTLQEAREYFEKDYNWVNDRWKEEEDLVDEMERIFERDVHVRRISKPEEYEPTDRMLNTAESSRQQIYRDAASLLKKRNRIFNGNKDEISELLNDTAITPDDEETLLELFVLFRFISTIENIESNNFSLATIESGSQRIATMESQKKEIAVYHDSSARDLDIEFKFDPAKDSEEPYSRPEEVELKSREIISNYFNKDTREVTGRPDVILVEIIDKESEDRDYFITEVKNSTNEKTIKRGIKEALEYLAFLRNEKGFIYKEEKRPFGGEKSGLLVIQDFQEDQDTQNLENQEGPIRIVQASKLEKNIQNIISEKIEL